MKITLRFVDQFGDVDLKYRDAAGEHSLMIAMDTENNLREIDILSDSLEIKVKPTKLD